MRASANHSHDYRTAARGRSRGRGAAFRASHAGNAFRREAQRTPAHRQPGRRHGCLRARVGGLRDDARGRAFRRR